MMLAEEEGQSSAIREFIALMIDLDDAGSMTAWATPATSIIGRGAIATSSRVSTKPDDTATRFNLGQTFRMKKVT